MKLRYFVLIFFSISAFGQADPEDFIDRDILEIGLIVDVPTGLHREKLKSKYISTNAPGMTFAYMVNPGFKKDKLSSIFLGGEFGFVGSKQSDFSNPPPDGDFFMNHRTVWLQFKGRYLPVIVPQKYFPHIDFSVGPVMYFSNMVENLGEDELDKFYNYKDTAINAKFEAGMQFNLRKDRKPYTFFGISVGFSASNPVKMLNRNKVGFDSDFKVIEAVNSHNPRGLYVKATFSSYR